MPRTPLTENMDPASIIKKAQTERLNRILDLTIRYKKALQGREGGVSATDIIKKHGFNPNAKDEKGNTPLHYAASYNDSEAIDTLLALKVSLEATDNKGRTAMHWAAGNGGADAIRLLHARGASLEALNADGETPLRYAARLDKAFCVDALIKCGANPRISTLGVSGEALSIISTAQSKLFDAESRAPLPKAVSPSEKENASLATGVSARSALAGSKRDRSQREADSTTPPLLRKKALAAAARTGRS